MTIKPTSARHVTTLLYLLRGYAEQQRRTHGPLVERPGGIELTPSEMDAWADEIEAPALLGKSPYAGLIKENCCADALPGNLTDEWLDTWLDT